MILSQYYLGTSVILTLFQVKHWILQKRTIVAFIRNEKHKKPFLKHGKDWLMKVMNC